MTNGGITEGHTENSGCSDLSPATFFGSGETRHANAEKIQWLGGYWVLCHLAPNTFMKHLALLLIVGASVSYGQQFNGTVFDLDSGRIQVINGEIDSTARAREESINRLRRINAELEVSLANMRQEAELRQQTRELREQTELLRKIANE
jgi:hypothetical protein